jgi:hypothetical protein
MPKRNLRIVKRSRNIPVRAICEFCNAEFSADPQSPGQLAGAQAALQQQFNAHKCKLQEPVETAVPAAKKKKNK